MQTLSSGDFYRFFEELHGQPPFPWQEALAKQVCEESWPQSIDLPTASGKTACIDIALFALAVLGSHAPRRIFFVVDRRVVVQEAFERAQKIRGLLAEPGDRSMVAAVAAALRKLAGGEDAEPLTAYELRGGTYRDEDWVRHPLQPMVIASTVDQVGSRLLFRGYGIKDLSWPIHAAMIANDSIVILDEAHCSKPFGQTLSAIERYRGAEWAGTPLGKPFHFVEMTATPCRSSARPFRIGAQDRENSVLRCRLSAKKPTSLLLEVKARKDDFESLASVLAAEAVRLVTEVSGTRAGIIVNRVKTARKIHEMLLDRKHDAILLIGRMRPFDRDSLMQKLEPLKSGKKRLEGTQPVFVVSTQCLEVGADLDFDILVSECAGIDALLQRFGRLDRTGVFGRARGSIAIASWQTDPNKPDAVYGEALANTWAWLKTISDGLPGSAEIDMGIEGNDGASTVREALALLPEEASNRMRMETADAPVLFPGHLDAWVQTSPVPMPDPEPSLFLHGPADHAADLQVVWRGDLGSDSRQWAEIVALCTPVAREAMPVQFVTFLKWVQGETREDPEQSDLDGRDSEWEESSLQASSPIGLIWRAGNRKPEVFWNSLKLRPGDTVVLPAQNEAWKLFGHFPEDAVFDVGDAARLDLKRKVTFRLHPDLIASWMETGIGKPLLEMLEDREWAERKFAEQIGQHAALFPDAIRKVADSASSWKSLQLLPYPSGKGYVLQGWISGKKSDPSGKVILKDHTKQVRAELESICAGTLSGPLQMALDHAADFHDAGKVDPRFQTWLRRGDSLAARFSPRLLAKSGIRQLGKQADSGLPQNFRHEFLSLLLAEKKFSDQDEYCDLTLHLIASHHGYCRPFAPVVIDENPPCISYEGLEICSTWRKERAAHRLSSGVPDRFWQLTRQYGWWGLAYLEALLRLADWKASDEATEDVAE